MRSKRKTHGRRRRKTTKIYSNRYKTNKRRRRKWKRKRTSRNINHGRKKLTYSLHGGAVVQNTNRNASGKLSKNPEASNINQTMTNYKKSGNSTNEITGTENNTASGPIQGSESNNQTGIINENIPGNVQKNTTITNAGFQPDPDDHTKLVMELLVDAADYKAKKMLREQGLAGN